MGRDDSTSEVTTREPIVDVPIQAPHYPALSPSEAIAIFLAQNAAIAGTYNGLAERRMNETGYSL